MPLLFIGPVVPQHTTQPDRLGLGITALKITTSQTRYIMIKWWK